MTHNLTFRAPRRNHIPTSTLPNGTWAWGSIPWTPQARALAESAGAWFGNAGDHDFAPPKEEGK